LLPKVEGNAQNMDGGYKVAILETRLQDPSGRLLRSSLLKDDIDVFSISARDEVSAARLLEVEHNFEMANLIVLIHGDSAPPLTKITKAVVGIITARKNLLVDVAQGRITVTHLVEVVGPRRTTGYFRGPGAVTRRISGEGWIERVAAEAKRIVRNARSRFTPDAPPIPLGSIARATRLTMPIPVRPHADREVHIMFATTRERTTNQSGYYSGVRQKLSYGAALVGIPKNRSIGSIPLPKEFTLFKLRIYKEAEDPDKHFTIQECEAMEVVEWKNAIYAFGMREAFVFVHGFNNSFRESLLRCAQVIWDIRYTGIPVLFSWASKGEGVTDYLYDTDSAIHARLHFIDLLMTLRSAGVTKVHILAHSMGNFLVLDALGNHMHNSRGELGLGELLMAAPDLDSHHYLEVAPKVRAAVTGMTLYASSKDRAMMFSKLARGHIPRAGDVPPQGPLLVDNVDAIDVTEVGAEIFGLNHGTVAEQKSILNDVKLLLSGGVRPPSERLAEIVGMPEDVIPSKWWKFAP
jgi:esterase/lipase superfamily enzyme